MYVVPGMSVPAETRAKAIFTLLLGIGIGGFLFLCVSGSTCGACYMDPCYCFKDNKLKGLCMFRSSVCFAGVTSGMFFCFLASWGALLTLRRRSSIMGFGHFFGATCVSFLVAVQSAGMWGAEASLLESFRGRTLGGVDAESWASLDDTVVSPNKGLLRAARFLYTVAVCVSCALLVLGPLYFVSHDVYDEDDGPPKRPEDTLNSRARRGFAISAYHPDDAADDERQYLGRASIPMRNIKPQYKEIPETPIDGL